MVSFTVLSCGFDAAALSAHPAHQSVVRVPDPTAEDFIEEAFASLVGVRDEQPIVVLFPDTPARDHRVRMLRAMTRSTLLVPVGFHLPPTALAARATWLAELARRAVPVGVALTHLRRDQGVLPTVAVVSSVAGVELPSVKMSHHAMSWLPWTRFGVALDGESRVGRNRGPEITLASGVYDTVWRGSQAMRSRVSFDLPAAQEEVPLGDAAKVDGWWDRDHFEQTFVPRDLGATIQHLRQQPFGRCPQCGSETADWCQLCSARLEGAA